MTDATLTSKPKLTRVSLLDANGDMYQWCYADDVDREIERLTAERDDALRTMHAMLDVSDERDRLRTALSQACVYLRRWRKREADAPIMQGDPDAKLFSATGWFCGQAEAGKLPVGLLDEGSSSGRTSAFEADNAGSSPAPSTRAPDTSA